MKFKYNPDKSYGLPVSLSKDMLGTYEFKQFAYVGTINSTIFASNEPFKESIRTEIKPKGLGFLLYLNKKLLDKSEITPGMNGIEIYEDNDDLFFIFNGNLEDVYK